MFGYRTCDGVMEIQKTLPDRVPVLLGVRNLGRFDLDDTVRVTVKEDRPARVTGLDKSPK